MIRLMNDKRRVAASSVARLLICGTASLAVFGLSGCALMSAAGPSSRTVNGTAEKRNISGANIKIVDVTDAVARRMLAGLQSERFADALGDGTPVGTLVGKGDVLDVVIWEAPPASLFGSMGGSGSVGAGGTTSLAAAGTIARGSTLPEQMVSADGTITIPFVGTVKAAGRAPQEIEREITSRLAGKAHSPQAIVRVVRNATSNVTIVGDVATSARIPLTPKGERLLDILAGAGGVKQPVGKTTVQITRDGKTVSQPLETVIKEARQNIRLQPNDVVTVLYQPYSFTALGAISRNEEVPFEGTGITLVQALGRIGGLRDSQADIRGAFLFRLEDPALVDPALREKAQLTPDGKLPIIYRIDLKDPATFFVAQSFPIRDKDVLYVSNAPLADLQKFVNVISSLVFPVVSFENNIAN